VETSPFLEVARQGRNEWWRYVVGFITIFTCWTGGQVMIAAPLILREPDPTRADLLLLALLLLSFAPGMAAVAVVVCFLHGRPFRTLITPCQRIGWNRLAAGFIGWLVIAAAAGVIEAVLHPGRYQPNPEPLSVLPFLLVAAMLIPIQAGTEELVYRGYLLQGTGSSPCAPGHWNWHWGRTRRTTSLPPYSRTTRPPLSPAVPSLWSVT